MKNLLLTAMLIVTFSVSAQNDNPKYDKALAEKLGADDYGMKSYIFVLLKTGPTKITDKDEVNRLFTGHMANITA